MNEKRNSLRIPFFAQFFQKLVVKIKNFYLQIKENIVLYI